MTRIPARTIRDRITRPGEVEEDSVLTVLRVPPELAGMRVDRFVQGELKRTSRTRAQKIVERSAFDASGRSLRSGDRVYAEQLVALWRPPWDEEVPDIPLTILHEDDAVLVVDKPPGVPVHPTARYFRSTVVKLLEDARPDERFMLGHRLDRETSGCLLLTKNSEADRHVKRQFMGHDPVTGRPSDKRFVDKQYLALCYGDPGPERDVDVPLELDPESRLGVKMRVAAPGQGLVARTRFERIEHRSRDNQDYSLVRCFLETGRQHQIRVHLAAVGCRIVGDKLYGPDDGLFARGADGELTEEDLVELELPRHALHAARLSFIHPRHGERVVVESPLPADLAEFWSALDATGHL